MIKEKADPMPVAGSPNPGIMGIRVRGIGKDQFSRGLVDPRTAVL